ncbi:Pkinase-domain-containing protein [Violaceomyces palustris]|uniref:Pkinase-domain-containing protein n=1 Tax=Violaceomyces palustris TaxID=1673888 RepID=A0ACD0NQT6_9BASI|nr:Pkinase-domain-containing protein [Violaceomyces palustris]
MSSNTSTSSSHLKSGMVTPAQQISQPQHGQTSFIPANSSPSAAMAAYRSYRDSVRRPVLSTYTILGFISSGTYGRVYKAKLRNPSLNHAVKGKGRASDSPIGEGSPWNGSGNGAGQVFGIKKFKPDSKESESSTYTGISQSAMREIALNRELRHENVVTLREVMFEDKSIYMVFEYAEHDFLQLIHHHSTVLRTPIGLGVLKSLLWQLLNGVAYLHANWVLHRDLKPANILVTSQGVVKIGDLGLARLYSAPLQSLYSGDKVVVTIWYRAPELLLGARHYTTAIDMWAVGCIWGELLALRPMFKGEEAKMDPKTKAAPFQTDQLTKIVEILGTPGKDRWPGIDTMPDYKGWWPHLRLDNYPKTLHSWYSSRSRGAGGYELFDNLLQYDPTKRITAAEALKHPWFMEQEPKPSTRAFSSLPKPNGTYPTRRLIQDDTDPKMNSMVSNLHAAAAAAAAIPGGNNNMLNNNGVTGIGGGNPLLSGVDALGRAAVSGNSSLGPAAPPPIGSGSALAPGSGPPTSTGSANSAGGNSGGGGSSTLQNSANRGGMLGTATANASAQAQGRGKRPRLV